MKLSINKITKEKTKKHYIPLKLINEATKKAEKISKQELIVFWLENKKNEPESRFNLWLKFVQESSKQELINMIHELELSGIKKFIQKFK